jgi:hypothetical protein
METPIETGHPLCLNAHGKHTNHVTLKILQMCTVFLCLSLPVCLSFCLCLSVCPFHTYTHYTQRHMTYICTEHTYTHTHTPHPGTNLHTYTSPPPYALSMYTLYIYSTYIANQLLHVLTPHTPHMNALQIHQTCTTPIHMHTLLLTKHIHPLIYTCTPHTMANIFCIHTICAHAL